VVSESAGSTQNTVRGYRAKDCYWNNLKNLRLPDSSHWRLAGWGRSKALVRSLMLNGKFYVTIFYMALTRSFKKTVVARIELDPAFANALLDEVATLFLSDELETARVILRDLVGSHFRRDWRPFESGN
jgi:hypothetical protein